MTAGTSGMATPSGEWRAPLVGRSHELSLLRKAARECLSGRKARTVTLVGAPGIGKTRLLEDFLWELSRDFKIASRIYRGRARAVDPSYGVFARMLRARFGLSDGGDAEFDAAKLRREVANVLEDRKVGDVCYVFGQILGLRFPESPITRALTHDPAQAGSLPRAVTKQFFERDAEAGPLCLLLDDLHAADQESLDLLCHLVEHLSGPILLLCGARPELVTRSERLFECGRDRHLRIDVGPLSDDQASELLGSLLDGCRGGVPEPLIRAALSMATGTPALLEQMLHLFQDSGVLQAADPTSGARWEVDLDRLSSAHLPLTVEDAVAARIAALTAESRRVLEYAAAIGSVFWLGGIAALSRCDGDTPELWNPRDLRDVDEIASALSDLVARDYVLQLPDSSFSDETEFVFKHNLERERLAALTSNTKSRRYHQIVADWLAQKDGVRSQQEYCAMLANHLERAGATLRAGLTYLEAGDLARQAFAAKRAHEHYARGLSLLGDGDAPRRIEALHNHGDVLLVIGKTDEALHAFREMRILAYRFGLLAKGGAAHNRIGRLYRDTGSLVAARQHLDTALELFRCVKDERGIAACHDDIGKLLWTRGEYDQALEQLMIALEIRKKIADRRSIALSLNNIGLVWMDHGRAAQAAEALEAALKIRRDIVDPLGVVESLTNLGRLAQGQDDHTRALELFREALEVAKDVGENYRIAAVLTYMGDCHYQLGATSEAIAILEQAEELCDELGDRLTLGQAKRGLAKAYLKIDDLRKAREAIKQAVDVFGQVRSKSHLATALRTLGEVTAAGAWGRGHEGRAVDYFMRSIAICKEIGNELEVAKSYKAFSSYVSESPHYKANADIQREAQTLSAMADEIFSRHRISPKQAASEPVPG
jgi:tetratricopeptide (TPR) repeat protein